MNRARTITLVALTVSIAAWLSAADFEAPPTLDANEVLEAGAAAGEHHTVEPTVTNDGFMNSYRVSSDFGDFESYGTSELFVLLREIGALAVLDELTKTEVFANAVKEGALGSVRAAETIVRNPVKTAKGVPEGVGKLFGRTKRSIKKGVETGKEVVAKGKEAVAGDDDASEGDACEGEECAGAPEEAAEKESKLDQAGEFAEDYARKYFGVNKAQRRWSQRLGVDPYTSNEVLIEAIEEVAKVDSAGRFATRLAPIPRIPGASTIVQINSLVWTMDAYELVQFNKKRLAEAGVAPELVDAFYMNPNYSPTQQTLLFTALIGLSGVADLGQAITQATTAESAFEGRFFVLAAQMMYWFHSHEAPVSRLLPGERAFVVETTDGRTVLHAPVDYLSWTPEIADAANRLSRYSGGDGGSLELWLLGDASDRVHEELDALGWRIETNVAPRVRASLAETRESEG